MPEMASILHAVAAMFAGGAAASGWTAAVIVANTAFDGLDHGRADRMLESDPRPRQASRRHCSASQPARRFFRAPAAGIVCAVAALGFLSNVWTLAPRRDKARDGLKKKNTTMRVVAVALTLIVTLVRSPPQ
jgi:hypothetical protein